MIWQLLVCSGSIATNIDTKQGQEVYHEGKGTTLKQFEDKIKREARAKKNFNAWLFTQQTKIKQHEQLHISKR